jgi:hypothetical protein
MLCIGMLTDHSGGRQEGKHVLPAGKEGAEETGTAWTEEESGRDPVPR